MVFLKDLLLAPIGQNYLACCLIAFNYFFEFLLICIFLCVCVCVSPNKAYLLCENWLKSSCKPCLFKMTNTWLVFRECDKAGQFVFVETSHDDAVHLQRFLRRLRREALLECSLDWGNHLLKSGLWPPVEFIELFQGILFLVSTKIWQQLRSSFFIYS